MTKFTKIRDGLYKNTESQKKINYKGYINKRNKSDNNFYNTRYKILQKEFESILLPLLREASRRFNNNKISILDTGCGDGLIIDVLSSIGKKTV